MARTKCFIVSKSDRLLLFILLALQNLMLYRLAASKKSLHRQRFKAVASQFDPHKRCRPIFFFQIFLRSFLALKYIVQTVPTSSPVKIYLGRSVTNPLAANNKSRINRLTTLRRRLALFLPIANSCIQNKGKVDLVLLNDSFQRLNIRNHLSRSEKTIIFHLSNEHWKRYRTDTYLTNLKQRRKP